jgi:hypothetical protein
MFGLTLLQQIICMNASMRRTNSRRWIEVSSCGISWCRPLDRQFAARDEPLRIICVMSTVPWFALMHRTRECLKDAIKVEPRDDVRARMQQALDGEPLSD